MAFTRMMAIEYNMWMSIIKLIKDTINSSTIKNEYDGFNGNHNIDILPAYPRNLTNFKKPSIIVQKVSTDNAPLCTGGGFIGQHYDEEDNAYRDVYGVNYESTYQIDVCGDSNIQRSLIMAILVDEMFNRIRFSNDSQVEIYNYALSLDNPELMGYAKLDALIDIQNLDKKYRSDNEYKLYNYDYTTAIRFDISMIQVVIPEQELVDLTKWIKVNQRIKL